MISLTCTSCRKLLEMDDAFAGGVCRCKFCGTIQTVPSKARDRNGARTKVASKAIYAKTARGEAIPSSGLDQLAQVVASSGLTSDRLRLHAPTPAVKPSKQHIMLLIAAALLLVLGIFIGAWFAVRGESSSHSPRPAAEPDPQPPMRAAPGFCEVSISEP